MNAWLHTEISTYSGRSNIRKAARNKALWIMKIAKQHRSVASSVTGRNTGR
jgi:hypothetical protein